MLEPTDYQIALAEGWGAEERMLLVPGAFGLRMAEAFTNLRYSQEHGLEQWTGRVWQPVTDQQLNEMLDVTSALVDVEAANASGVLRKPARVAAYAADSRTPAFREQAVAALTRGKRTETCKNYPNCWCITSTTDEQRESFGAHVAALNLNAKQLRDAFFAYRMLVLHIDHGLTVSRLSEFVRIPAKLRDAILNLLAEQGVLARDERRRWSVVRCLPVSEGDAL